MSRMHSPTPTQNALPSESAKAEIERLAPWFQNIHLPDGQETAPDHWLGDFPAYKWRDIAPCLPADLTGWSVLEIGCNAGYYAVELARRGAQVLGIDHNLHFLKQAAWVAARFGLQERIRLEKMEVYELNRLPQQFDLVLFMGVFYHLRYPLLGLDLAADRTRRMLIFQTLMMPGQEVAEVPEDLHFHDRERMHERGFPKMAFIEHKLTGDPTNWWVANHAGIEAMLRSANLRVVSRPLNEVYICKPVPGGRVVNRALPTIRTEDPI